MRLNANVQIAVDPDETGSALLGIGRFTGLTRATTRAGH